MDLLEKAALGISGMTLDEMAAEQAEEVGGGVSPARLESKTMTTYKRTQVENYESETTYYTERKITPADYKSEFGKGYALKKGQRLITIRDIITKPTAEQIKTAKLKN